jgi:hypothetical protein
LQNCKIQGVYTLQNCKPSGSSQTDALLAILQAIERRFFQNCNPLCLRGDRGTVFMILNQQDRK